jgi:hypothetical protein
MPWIESHTSLARHPKTLRLARILGIPVPAALGHMHLLWWWAIEYAPDGDVGRFDAAEVALACMWEGEAAALLPALQRAGFVDTDGRIHDWHDYAGKLVDRRRRNAERMREDRATHVADAPSINSDTCDARASHVQSEPDARVKLQDSTNRTVPTEPTSSAPNGAGPALHAVPKPSKPKLPTHPAVRVLRQTLGFSPDERQRETISQCVGSDEEAVLLFTQCCTAWKDAGYNSRNLAGVLDWFQEGGPPPRERSPNGAAQRNGALSTSKPPSQFSRNLQTIDQFWSDHAPDRDRTENDLRTVHRKLPGELSR